MYNISVACAYYFPTFSKHTTLFFSIDKSNLNELFCSPRWFSYCSPPFLFSQSMITIRNMILRMLLFPHCKLLVSLLLKFAPTNTAFHRHIITINLNKNTVRVIAHHYVTFCKLYLYLFIYLFMAALGHHCCARAYICF